MNCKIIAISGEAGQGIQTFGDLLARSFFRAGFFIYTDRSYHSRIRGGQYIYRIRLAEEPVYTMRERIDVLVSLSSATTKDMKKFITDDIHILADSGDTVEGVECEIHPFKEAAVRAGEKRAFNVVILGSILREFRIDKEIPEALIRKAFEGNNTVLNSNLEALRLGYEMDLNLQVPDLKRNDDHKKVIMTGTDGAGLGAISAGCKFLSAYPMTPGTGIMTFLAKRSEKYDIVVEQAEDEIAAINMAIGASFAGARAMVTTSGGGFALMQESVSLAGMTETPVVIVDAQRPGPATGLPTRTAQEDLYFVLKSGHGEFPRYVAAPRTPEEAFSLMEKAFYMADKYQIPSIVLLSQQLTDSTVTIDEPVHEEAYEERFILKNPGESYRRYELTESGISPRTIPGKSSTIKADSDEHDEEGVITEDLDLRIKMVEKRMKKEVFIAQEIDEPLAYNLEADTILLGWGDSWGAIDEFVRENPGLGYIHFNELWPLNTKIIKEMSSKHFISIEGNYTGQFAELLSSQLEHKIGSLGRYDGRPITIEWLATALAKEGIL